MILAYSRVAINKTSYRSLGKTMQFQRKKFSRLLVLLFKFLAIYNTNLFKNRKRKIKANLWQKKCMIILSQEYSRNFPKRKQKSQKYIKNTSIYNAQKCKYSNVKKF